MMRIVLIGLMAILFIPSTKAQNISGQWKGEFIDNSSKFGSWGGDKCEYVLELEARGNKVTGYSYTYFSNGDKKYFTICKLAGTYDKSKKYVEVKEFERTKTNVPVEIGNCFQVHKLTFYKKTDGDESLEGSWVPAPDQKGNCGYGATILTRRNLKASFPGFKNPSQSNNYSRVNAPKATTGKPATAAVKPVINPNKKIPNLADKNKPATVKPKFVEPKPKVTTTVQQPVLAKKDTQLQQTQTSVTKPIIAPATVSGNRYEKRNNTVIKTIEVENELVKIDFYDNGEIDGDSISVFLNGKLLVARKKLTTQPITLTLTKDELQENNELVMYAENLGSIPPNTALMIVTDGKKRYEVRITSDLQKSGTIRFIKKDN
ncbi:MAG: hypothetical protein EOP51_12905 [Sphingobacteriales bacterium]|nr:MAG: hypothetical protein EOP51_12905 [Sphingobacteriales bacterium]